MVEFPILNISSGIKTMLLLTGEYQHVVDGKSRVLISNKLRSQIDADEHGNNFYLVLGANGILCLYPEKYFEQVALAVAPGTAAPDEAVAFERMSFALAGKVELDGQGRLLLNERLRKRAGSERPYYAYRRQRPYRAVEQRKLGTISFRPYGSIPETDVAGTAGCPAEAERRTLTFGVEIE